MVDLEVLVVGANGNLGRRVVDALAARPERLAVRAGVRRPGSSGEDRSARSIVETRVDLADPGSLDEACRGVDVVISTVQGGPDVIVDGQTRLLEACDRQGVDRLVPSDFSLDLFALSEGENWNCDARRSFDERLRASAVHHTFFLNGGFMEALASPFIAMLDAQRGTVDLWGDGDDAIDMTTMDDAAAFVAAAVVRPETRDATVAVVGDRRTGRQVADDHATATGRPTRFSSRGSIADGYAELERRKAENADPLAILSLMYVLPMLSQKARLRDVRNDDFPEVEPKSLRDFFTAFAGRR